MASYHLICCVTFIAGNFLNGLDYSAIIFLFLSHKFKVHALYVIRHLNAVMLNMCQMREYIGVFC